MSRVSILVAGLLLFTLGTVVVGNKMRGSGSSAVAVQPTPTPTQATNGRISGFDDDPVLIYCRLDEHKIDVYRRMGKAEVHLTSIDLDAVARSAPQPLVTQVGRTETLTLSKEPLGRLYLTFQQQDTDQQVGYFGKYFTCQ